VVVVRRLLWAADGGPSPWRRVLGRLARALYAHRFALVVVLLVGALVSLPGGEVFDQFPDAVRAWADGPRGAGHLAVAVGALGVLAVVVFVLGRLRSTRAWQRFGPGSAAADRGARADPHAGADPGTGTGGDPEGDPAYGWWLVVPGGALVLAGVARLGLGDVDGRALAFFVLPVPVLLLLSLGVRRLCRTGRVTPWRPPPEPRDPAYAVMVWRTGDVLAAAVLAIGGAGLVRAFTAPAVLGVDRRSLVALVLGFAAVAVAWPLAALAVRAVDVLDRAPSGWRSELAASLRPDRIGRRRRGVGTALAVAAVAVLVVLAVYPLSAAGVLGVVGLLTLALTCLVVLAALVVLQAQRTRPLELFTLLRMRRTPVLTLLLTVPLAASLHGGDPDVHRIRAGTASVPPRPALAEAFAAWAGTPPECTARGSVAGRPVRPLVLVAAAGGGIRAAVWTTGGLQVLAGACGPRAAFLSSGVSGGSVGLVLARADASVAAARARALAEPTPLAAAVDGLLVRDLVGGAVGVRLHARQAGRDLGWLDRAGLLEQRWEQLAPSLAEPFVRAPGSSGVLVLNSTSVGTACRVLLSDVTLPVPAAPPAGERRDPDCHSPADGLPAASFDLFGVYGPCLGNVAASTAALLSARFAYVTPSGVVSGCEGLTQQQLVDGGYAESDGLGTLVDLAPALMRLVREHNARALATPGEPVVVPTVVFLQNHFGTDVSAPPSSTTSELLVPRRADRAAPEQQAFRALRQRLVELVAEPCPATAPCAAEAEQALPSFVQVAPATRPLVTAPLGWTLSRASLDGLDAALREQTGPACARPLVAGEPARLCDLLAALQPR
jgi:hypothetical protein